ncbi:hypothetical protein ES708_21291 [subsurface metagenome]
MALEIKWTKQATTSFYNTIDYLEEEWSERYAQKFVQIVNRFLHTLQEQPEIGKIEVAEKGIRGFVLSRQNTVFYRIKGQWIILLKFFDNRQHPSKKFTTN